MPGRDKPEGCRRFSETTYAIPFGIYASGDAEPPANEVLVGREGRRAYLIDLLINTGRRAAFLVTGRRGSGKTTFVNHCLGEYQASVFKRFLSSHVGRDLLDLTGLLLLWLLILCGGILTLSKLMQAFGAIAGNGNGNGDGDVRSLLSWVVMVPLGLLSLYPVLYARELFQAIVSDRGHTRHRGHASSDEGESGFRASSLVFVFGAVCWYSGPFGSLPLGVSRLFTVIGGLYFFAQWTSYKRRYPELITQEDIPTVRALRLLLQLLLLHFLRLRLLRPSLLRFLWLRLLLPRLLRPHLLRLRLPLLRLLRLRFLRLFFIVFATAYVAIGSHWWRDLLPAELEPAELEYWFNLVGGLWLLAIGHLLRARHHSAWRDEEDDDSPASVMGSSAKWYRRSAFFHLFLILPILASQHRSVAALGWKYALALGSILLLVPLLVCWRRQPGGQQKVNSTFRPLSRELFSLKAVFVIVVALQMCHPMLSRIPEPWEGIAASVSERWPSLGRDWSAESWSSLRTDSLYRRDSAEALTDHYLSPCRVEGPPARRGKGSPSSRCDEALQSRSSADPLPLRRDERLWLLALFLSVVTLYFIEYEWIVRPSTLAREDPSLHRGAAPSLMEVDAAATPTERRRHRRYAELTLPWVVFKTWLPMLVVKVNLGFDKLDHRRIVQAMLAGLRDQYQRRFLAWNSGLANLGRLLGFLFLIGFVYLTARVWFDPAQLAGDPDRPDGLMPCPDETCTDELPPPADRLLCGWEAEALRATLYFNLFPIAPQAELHWRVYHAVLFLIFFVAGRALSKRLPVLPYARNLRRIDDLLESLSARTKWTSKKGLWKPATWIYGLLAGDGAVRQTEMDPVDPRAVELAFLKILEDLQMGSVLPPGAVREHLSIPVPELTFVFDELDKLGSRAVDAGAGAPFDVPNAERQRALALQALISELKNIISSAPARFIFVGGRNLHDEWLADRTSRQPLLTNVFNAEIYLPSLMLDHDRDKHRYLDYWVKRYVYHQHERAKRLYSRWARRQWRPLMSLSVESPRPETFAVAGGDEAGGRSPLPEYLVWNCGNGKPVAGSECLVFLRNFIFFLTYRSKGNPKRLRDLFATFVRPVGRVLQDQEALSKPFHCKHVLQFNDDAVFRIQLLVDLYRHVAVMFQKQLLNRDDKLAISVFHMVDFMLGFHRRAFSWRNLERADVLAHIHRAPDLRLVVEDLVEHCSERFLHRVVNGMYAFRFRSDLAREVEYISRQSAEEMAAFNFTLDESQSLKALYADTLKSMGEGEVVHELVAGLGELYELDQEYELARQHYRRAIRIADDDLKNVMGNPGDTETYAFRPVLDILEGKEAGSRYARFSTTWGIVRLRLMLQIGMTFELTRDLKRALAEYASARALAAALLEHYLGFIKEGFWSKSGGGGDGAHGGDRLHELKQLDILFLPTFAEAWAFEKLPGTLDTGHSLVEEELWRLRTSLPFVRDPTFDAADDPTHMQHSNFALIMSQLHVKAGDLYFFKGRQAISVQEIALRPDLNKHHEGYLLRAHYHYAVGLHDLRSTLAERQQSSETQLHIGDPKNRWPTIRTGQWPDLFSRAVGNCLADIAEATLARTSFFGVVRGGGRDLGFLTGEVPSDCQSFGELCDQWLEGNSRKKGKKEKKDLPKGFDPDLGEWFGEWVIDPMIRESDRRLARFTSPAEPDQRLLMALHLSLAGARYKEKGGYPEDAAREYLHVCETVSHYLWWGHGLVAIQQWFQQWFPKKTSSVLGAPLDVYNDASNAFWNYLLEMACWTLEKTNDLFRQSRRDDYEENRKYLIGDVIPPFALTLLCSLGIVSDAGTQSVRRRSVRRNLRRLLRRWTGETNIPQGRQGFVCRLRDLLLETIRRHSYPMINRLQAIKVLIDDTVLLRSAGSGDSEAIDQAIDWALELLELKDSFKAPFHFTPLYSGVTFAQLWLKAKPHEREVLWKSRRHDIRRIYRAAQRDLRTSEEMYTMRRAFYLAVSDLYYLYDDFNDRQIHFNHAVQMAGTEWAAVLARLVRDNPPGE